MLAIDSTGEDTYTGGQVEPVASSHNGSRATSKRDGLNGRWLSIHAACEILGVDKSTLRRWSDNGRVPVFRTPGGHRRYSEEDLYAFLAGDVAQRRRISRRELAAMTRDEFERRKLPDSIDQYAHSTLPEAWAIELSDTRDRMIDLSIRYASGRGNPDRLLADARELAREYGRCTARARLETSEAVESFLRFRRPLLDALGRYGEKQHLSTRRSCRMIGKLNAYLDVMLTSLVEAHEAFSRE